MTELASLIVLNLLESVCLRLGKL